MKSGNRILVTGAGGFIGHHLVKALKDEGHWVRGVDIKHSEFATSPADEFEIRDLRLWNEALEATRHITYVYNLAADMGGIGYISSNFADITRNNVLTNTHLLEGARTNGVQRFLFASSACVYPRYRQANSDVTPLREEDALPADPEPGYGWEKLFSEQLCSYYLHDYAFATRIVRFHNVYGPLGTYDGGKEKAPAAICRKVALASDGGSIEVWGDGAQTRSFLYIADCVEGLLRLMASDYPEPLNLGTEEIVSVEQLVDLVSEVAGKKLFKHYERSKPQGVRGRNSDNSQLRAVLGWEPATSLRSGIAITYSWIEAELRKAGRLPAHRESAAAL